VCACEGNALEKKFGRFGFAVFWSFQCFQSFKVLKFETGPKENRGFGPQKLFEKLKFKTTVRKRPEISKALSKITGRRKFRPKQYGQDKKLFVFWVFWSFIAASWASIWSLFWQACFDKIFAKIFWTDFRNYETSRFPVSGSGSKIHRKFCSEIFVKLLFET